jgi:hypothetical protein
MMFPFYVNLVLVSCLFALIACGNVEQIVLRGVETSRKYSILYNTKFLFETLVLSKYIPSKPFTCLDGSSTLPYEFVNDDYCDCRGKQKK